MTKCLDQVLFQFYAKNDGVRITDLHQGIVWGTHTDQTRRHDQLINRFDYDGDYGTVLNRFLIQAALEPSRSPFTARVARAGRSSTSRTRSAVSRSLWPTPRNGANARRSSTR